ncbi:GPI inositol-deacylase-like [Amphiura filiformis]|uniref:GPI inositol-deacylase-like n=1 Tax=Amphiura filiformis TaxID=82378 RepID=UPI003B21EB65
MAARNKILCSVLLAILSWGLYDILTNFEPNGCAMTYMFEYPKYLDVPGLPENVQEAYPRYSLYLYGEGRYAQESTIKSRNLNLQGIPVLFVPGNAGSYKQVRSLGSVALRKAARFSFHFNYFSVDFSGEFSGLYGPVLQEQTEFVHHCIQHILTLYSSTKDPPTSVLLVGHSMGGLIARALFTLPNFDTSLVHTIITQATPQQNAVINIDCKMSAFYSKVNQYWQENVNSSRLQDVTVLSVGGGHRDFQVRTGLTSLDGIVPESRGLSVTTTGVPSVWLSTDHLCVVWCKELVMATKRAIFDIVDKKTKKISTDVEYKMSVFQHHFDVHNGKEKASVGTDVAVNFDEAQFEVVEGSSLYLSGSFSKRTTHYLFPIKPPHDSFVVVASIPYNKWVFVCTKGDSTSCTEGVDVSWRGKKIPPLRSGMRELHLRLSEFPEASSVVVKVTNGKHVPVSAELYSAEPRHISYTLPGLFAREEGKTVIKTTQPGGSTFYSISLDELTKPHQAFTAKLISIQCQSTIDNDANSTLGLHIPWSKEDSFSVIPAREDNTLPLKVHSGQPAHDTRLPQLLVYVNPRCQYKLEIHTAFGDMFGQLFRFHMGLIPCFMVINCLLVLAFHLKHIYTTKPLESFVWVQSSYCKPYIVVPPIALFRGIFKYDPLDTTFDLRMLEDKNISYGLLPLLMFLFGYALICMMASMLSIKLQVGGKITQLFQRPKTEGSSTEPTSSLYRSIAISGVLLALGVGTCGELALLGALVVYYFRVGSLRGKETFHYHFSVLMLLMMLVILNGPSLLVWYQNLKYSMHLTNDPALHSALIVCATLVVLLNPGYTLPKSRRLAKLCSWIFYLIAILMVLYASYSMYRLSYFIAAVFVLVALIQVMQ